MNEHPLLDREARKRGIEQARASVSRSGTILPAPFEELDRRYVEGEISPEKHLRQGLEPADEMGRRKKLRIGVLRGVQFPDETAEPLPAEDSAPFYTDDLEPFFLDGIAADDPLLRNPTVRLKGYEALRIDAKRAVQENQPLGGMGQFNKPGEHDVTVRVEPLPELTATAHEHRQRRGAPGRPPAERSEVYEEMMQAVRDVCEARRQQPKPVQAVDGSFVEGVRGFVVDVRVDSDIPLRADGK